MKSVLESQYPDLLRYVDEPGACIVYVPRFREFALKVLNGPGESFQGVGKIIDYCPFTGRTLPSSLRDTYFDRLDELKVDDSDDAPGLYHSEEWWVSEGL